MRQRKIWAGLVLVLLCTLAMGMSVFAADTTMKNKKWVSGQGGAYVDSDKDGKVDNFQSWGKSYYKIQIPKQGYIVVEAKLSSLPGEKQYMEYMSEDSDRYEEVDHSTSLSLLNSKKKQLAEHNNFWLSRKNHIVFTAVVKKGTYYVAAEGDQKYQLRYSYTPVSKVSKTGKRPAKAVSLKKGKTVKSLITGDRDQYFKISLKDKSKVTLAFNAQVRATMSEGLNIQFLIKKGKVCKVIDEKGKLVSNGNLYYEVKGKDKVTVTLPKGTYYIRAFAWEGTGGYYTMKWR